MFPRLTAFPGFIVRLLRLACLMIAGGWAVAALPGADVRVGRAKVDLTPPVGSVMGNSYGITVVTGVTSRIHAKAVVFETAEGKAAIVACDLISLHTPIVERARKLIAEKTGVAPDRVILAATHCHAGPQTHPLLYSLAGESAERLSAA